MVSCPPKKYIAIYIYIYIYQFNQPIRPGVTLNFFLDFFWKKISSDDLLNKLGKASFWKLKPWRGRGEAWENKIEKDSLKEKTLERNNLLLHPHVHAHVHTYKYTYHITCIPMCVHMHKCAYMYVCVRTCIHTSNYVRVTPGVI